MAELGVVAWSLNEGASTPDAGLNHSLNRVFQGSCSSCVTIVLKAGSILALLSHHRHQRLSVCVCVIESTGLLFLESKINRLCSSFLFRDEWLCSTSGGAQWSILLIWLTTILSSAGEKHYILLIRLSVWRLFFSVCDLQLGRFPSTPITNFLMPALAVWFWIIGKLTSVTISGSVRLECPLILAQQFSFLPLICLYHPVVKVRISPPLSSLAINLQIRNSYNIMRRENKWSKMCCIHYVLRLLST